MGRGKVKGSLGPSKNGEIQSEGLVKVMVKVMNVLNMNVKMVMMVVKVKKVVKEMVYEGVG